MPKMHIPPPEFVAWADACFQNEEERNRFLTDVAGRPPHEVEAQPTPNECRSARVRWLPGQFLALNDMAYAHGGRIVFIEPRRRGE
jgi:hypothetical protein